MLKSRLPVVALEIPARVDTAIGVAAHLIAGYAKARAPVGAPVVHLRDAIHAEQRGEPGDWYVVAGDDDAWYGHLVEFGTAHSAPQPFLVPAAEDGRPEAVALVRAALRGL